MRGRVQMYFLPGSGKLVLPDICKMFLIVKVSIGTSQTVELFLTFPDLQKRWVWWTEMVPNI